MRTTALLAGLAFLAHCGCASKGGAAASGEHDAQPAPPDKKAGGAKKKEGGRPPASLPAPGAQAPPSPGTQEEALARLETMAQESRAPFDGEAPALAPIAGP